MELHERLSTQASALAAENGGRDPFAEIKNRIHLELVSELGPRLFDVADSESVRRTVEEGIRDRLRQEAVLAHEDRQRLAAEIADDIFGYGPLERLLNDSSISEVMVNGCEDIWIERDGLISQTPLRFSDDSQLRRIITKMVGQIGRRIDESSPMVDARLPDGSRVNAIIPPLSLSGPLLTIRRFAKERFGMGELIGTGTLSRDAADFLSRGIEADLNMLISGGTGSGKTTMLNALSAAVPDSDRIVTIEDAAELQLKQRHVVRLESRPKNIEGEGEVTIRDLVRNSLRIRPDRIIVGEVRGAEALDMLQAMNTGHEGSLSTVHANSPRDALNRIETMVLMSGKKQQTQRLAPLSGSRQRQRPARESRSCRSDRVQRVILATQPLLVTSAAADLEHRLAVTAQMASKPGTVMTCAFDRPNAATAAVLLDKPHCLRITARTRTHRLLRQHSTARRNNDREHMLIAVRVDADHVIHLICKHLVRSSGFTRRVRCTPVWVQGNRAARL